MLGIIVRAVAAAVSFVAVGASGMVLAVVSRNPEAAMGLSFAIWLMVLGLAAFCALAFSLSLSRQVLGRTGA